MNKKIEKIEQLEEKYNVIKNNITEYLAKTIKISINGCKRILRRVEKSPKIESHKKVLEYKIRDTFKLIEDIEKMDMR